MRYCNSKVCINATPSILCFRMDNFDNPYFFTVFGYQHQSYQKHRILVASDIVTLVWGSLRLDTYPNPAKYIKKNPDGPFFFRSFIIFYLRRFTILNEVGLLTDGDTSKSHDSPTTFKMALYSWPKF